MLALPRHCFMDRSAEPVIAYSSCFLLSNLNICHKIVVFECPKKTLSPLNIPDHFFFRNNPFSMQKDQRENEDDESNWGPANDGGMNGQMNGGPFQRSKRYYLQQYVFQNLPKWTYTDITPMTLQDTLNNFLLYASADVRLRPYRYQNHQKNNRISKTNLWFWCIHTPYNCFQIIAPSLIL